MNQGSGGAAEAGHGLFITFEGGDGAGKSTHIRFLAKALRDRGAEVLSLREPGGTPIGEKIRKVVLDPENSEMTDECELLLFEAARAQIVSEVIKPALERGAVVLCDRFTDSTIAYQAHGRGLSREFVQHANEFACQGLVPDRTILLTVGGPASSLKRATRRGADRMERNEDAFHQRVGEGFRAQAAADPGRIRVVTSAGKRSETARAVFAELEDLFPWMADPKQCPPKLFESLDRRRRYHRGKRKRNGQSGKGQAR